MPDSGWKAATVADVVSALESLYPPSWADVGDPVGLTVGDPTAAVQRILLAVDPVQAVVDEAVTSRADLLVVHHPLLFRAVHAVAADRPKGRVVHDLVGHQVALFVAHTNADVADSGVSDSLARALGLVDLRPLVAGDAGVDKVVTFVPHDAVGKVVDALADAGAGSLGEYDRCAFLTTGEGTFRPGPAANPAIGTPGLVEVVGETRVEMVLPRERREAVLAALRLAHPYEEPAFDLFKMVVPARRQGHGRVGRLTEPTTLREFAGVVAERLPATATGVRFAGDPGRRVETVAVLGGAGDSMLDDARAAAVDVYLTSDLRHHPASEFLEYGDGPALVDVPHWAAEWTWLPTAARELSGVLERNGFAPHIDVSRLTTDPWTHHEPSPGWTAGGTTR